jgi:hypothetical protein
MLVTPGLTRVGAPAGTSVFLHVLHGQFFCSFNIMKLCLRGNCHTQLSSPLAVLNSAHPLSLKILRWSVHFGQCQSQETSSTSAQGVEHGRKQSRHGLLIISASEGAKSTKWGTTLMAFLSSLKTPEKLACLSRSWSLPRCSFYG